MIVCVWVIVGCAKPTDSQINRRIRVQNSPPNYTTEEYIYYLRMTIRDEGVQP